MSVVEAPRFCTRISQVGVLLDAHTSEDRWSVLKQIKEQKETGHSYYYTNARHALIRGFSNAVTSEEHKEIILAEIRRLEEKAQQETDEKKKKELDANIEVLFQFLVSEKNFVVCPEQIIKEKMSYRHNVGHLEIRFTPDVIFENAKGLGAVKFRINQNEIGKNHAKATTAMMFRSLEELSNTSESAKKIHLKSCILFDVLHNKTYYATDKNDQIFEKIGKVYERDIRVDLENYLAQLNC